MIDLLAIAAHPDDVEITCGGAMIKAADAGKKTAIIDLTAGEMGTFGTSDDRKQEAGNAADVMGLADRRNMHMPDSRLENSLANQEKLAAVIRELKPSTVILPCPKNQRHPDHRIASQMGYDACFMAGLKKADIEGEPHRPRKIIYTSSFMKIKHSFFVDITDQWERKKEAVAAYQTQFGDLEKSKQLFKPGPGVFKLMEIYHKKYGIEVECDFAEAYWMADPILIDDITGLSIRSL